MKRGEPLRRRKGLSRSELKADVEKVREFMQRGRQGLERSPARRKAGVSAKEGPLSPREWRIAVFEASGGRCIISGARTRDVDDRRFHAHHCLPKRELRARGLYGYVWDPRNGIWLSALVHERHEGASRRVPWSALPPAVWEFCTELDQLAGTLWATDLVMRGHPRRAAPGSLE